MLTALSSLTELVSGYIKEDLKNLFRPSSLVAAAIFVALQVLLVFPPLINIPFVPVLTLMSMPAIVQVFLTLLVITVLGYIINSLGGVFLSLVSGSAFRDSPIIGGIYLWLQKQAWKDLQQDQNEVDAPTSARAQYRLYTEYPEKKSELGLTRLGNILAATGSYTFTQYGAHLETLWPTMSAVLAEKDENLGKSIEDNREALVFLTTLTILLILVMMEFVFAWLATDRPLNSVWAIVLLVLVYATYAAGSQKALAWSRDVRTAFDLFLDEVAKKFYLRDLPKHEFDKRRKRWEGFSKWLVYHEPPQTGWYKEPVDVQPVVTHPPSVKVQSMIWKLENPVTGSVAGLNVYALEKTARYLFGITNEESGKHARDATGVYLVVEDGRLAELPLKVNGELIDPAPENTPIIIPGIPEGVEPKLRWLVGTIPIKSSRLLDYDITWDEVRIELSNAVFETDPEITEDKKRFTIKMIKILNKKTDVQILVRIPQDKKLPGLGRIAIKGGKDYVAKPEINDPLKKITCAVAGIEKDQEFSLMFLRREG